MLNKKLFYILIILILSIISCSEGTVYDFRIEITGDTSDATISYTPKEGDSDLGYQLYKNVPLPYIIEDEIRADNGFLGEHGDGIEFSIRACDNTNANPVRIKIYYAKHKELKEAEVSCDSEYMYYGVCSYKFESGGFQCVEVSFIDGNL